MAIDQYLQGIQNATSGEKADVKTATTDLSALQTGGGTLASKLKEALNTKLNNNKDIINQQADTMQNYFNSGSAAREKYQDVWDPFKKATLVQQDRSMALRPYDVLTGVLDQRMGNVADITEAGVSGWKGVTDAATTRLNSAQTSMATALQSYLAATGQQEAADALGFQIAQQQEQSRQYGITSSQNQSQFNQQLDLTKAQNAQAQSNWLADFNKPSGSGIGNISDLASIFDLIGGGENTEAKPSYPITQNKRVSDEGQWMANPTNTAWIPYTPNPSIKSSGISLKNTTTGEIYDYPSENDSDYLSDLEQGFIPL